MAQGSVDMFAAWALSIQSRFKLEQIQKADVVYAGTRYGWTINEFNRLLRWRTLHAEWLFGGYDWRSIPVLRGLMAAGRTSYFLAAWTQINAYTQLDLFAPLVREAAVLGNVPMITRYLYHGMQDGIDPGYYKWFVLRSLRDEEHVHMLHQLVTQLPDWRAWWDTEVIQAQKHDDALARMPFTHKTLPYYTLVDPPSGRGNIKWIREALSTANARHAAELVAWLLPRGHFPKAYFTAVCLHRDWSKRWARDAPVTQLLYAAGMYDATGVSWIKGRGTAENAAWLRAHPFPGSTRMLAVCDSA